MKSLHEILTAKTYTAIDLMCFNFLLLLQFSSFASMQSHFQCSIIGSLAFLLLLIFFLSQRGAQKMNVFCCDKTQRNRRERKCWVACQNTYLGFDGCGRFLGARPWNYDVWNWSNQCHTIHSTLVHGQQVTCLVDVRPQLIFVWFYWKKAKEQWSSHASTSN